jgi:predicted transcriptional regulator
MMSQDEYRKARLALGLSVHEWIDALGISESSHKKYNAGIRPVPVQTEKLIMALLKIQHLCCSLKEFRRSRG